MKDILSAVEKNRQLIFDAEKYIWENPETGYKEFKTTKYLADAFQKLGYELHYAEDITGFYTWLDTGKEGANILIMGELDSVICPSHPDADKTTGAVHACGHNVQCSALLGIAATLKEPNILKKFSGKIMLCAVPAEELLEIEYRTGLKEQGKIKYYGGKPEFLSRGYFDEIDVAFMVHANGLADKFMFTKGSVGCIAQKIIYKGKAAHAGGSPWLGQNALYAATCGLNAVNAIRETFKESDIIRVHPIITHGGDMVNAIPEQVEIESYVRGVSFEAINEANKRVNQAFIGGALSLNANVEIIDIPGYAPRTVSAEFQSLAEKAMKTACPDCNVSWGEISSGSTDMGDISCVMPALHPYVGGVKGKAHGNDFFVTDREIACIDNVKFQMTLLYMLCENNGAKAKEIKKNYKPRFKSRQEYFEYIDKMACFGDRIKYCDDTAKIEL